jgi:hypothetical protein
MPLLTEPNQFQECFFLQRCRAAGAAVRVVGVFRGFHFTAKHAMK